MKTHRTSDLSETHMLGEQTEYSAVRGGEDDQRHWLSQAPICYALRAHRIIHTGIMHARAPLKVVRARQSGTYFMATVEGSGEVLVDGDWKRTGPGEACLLPPRYPNAFRAIAGEGTWTFCWVRYLEPDRQIPITPANHPVLGPFDSEALIHAYKGLRASCDKEAYRALMPHWVELIHGCVQSFAGPRRQDDRVWSAWETVQSRLNEHWNLETIAQLAHVSPEHFRRMCHTFHGRSPVKHLAFLRIQHAIQLLGSSSDTVEAIAAAVGYETPAAFSKALRRWTGCCASELREPAAT